MESEKMLWGIRLIRAFSALVEVSAVVLLLRMNDIRPMIRLNGMLGMVGPLIFISVSALGLAEGLGRIPPAKLALVAGGVVLVLLGTRP